MMHVEQLQIEIESLPRREFLRLRTWFLQKDWENWDQQLAEDLSSGKLDFLLEEALIAKEQRTLREL
jgi:hypothetical protein